MASLTLSWIGITIQQAEYRKDEEKGDKEKGM
jgi:hypothetical protein